ncbi:MULTISPECIES: hypothetical protein [Natrialba]|uniref:DUF3784 domain-containing protein n=1 Tax=Natrialba swarupiae TaxID=2448032 RepID=A0A5D5AT09_9EURY|nr:MULTISPECIES: hypothetical protein [Natrialba]MCW8172646.1 hypothetical protein [Natrialba swarupiae]MWV39528.1 hypothetical protein [Natrialba sp. INN-245]TYT63002.1 hypothetical protein FYC77_04980 [Natrialba swarupiae]
MVDFNVVSGLVWLGCGLLILYLGYLIAFRGRAELHGNYDESVDPAYVSRWAGGTALLMGVLVVLYGIQEIYYGFRPYALVGLVVALLVLSYVSKLFAGGFGYQE